MATQTYTTKRGHKVTLLNIGGLLEEFYLSHQDEPKPPTYEVVNELTGQKSEKEFTGNEGEFETDAERAAWADYLRRVSENKDKTANEFTNLILYRGLDIDDDAARDWAKEQKELFGINAPTDSNRRKLHYLKTEILYGKPEDVQEDIINIISGVIAASGVPEEKVAQLQEFFRRSMGNKLGAGSAARESGQAPAESGDVALQSPVPGA